MSYMMHVSKCLCCSVQASFSHMSNYLWPSWHQNLYRHRSAIYTKILSLKFRFDSISVSVVYTSRRAPLHAQNTGVVYTRHKQESANACSKHWRCLHTSQTGECQCMLKTLSLFPQITSRRSPLPQLRLECHTLTQFIVSRSKNQVPLSLFCPPWLFQPNTCNVPV